MNTEIIVKDVNREAWLRRYQRRFEVRCPHLTSEQIWQLATNQAYIDLSGDYPADPERAADLEIDDFMLTVVHPRD